MTQIVRTNGNDFSMLTAVIAVNTSGQYEPNAGGGGGGGGITPPGSSTNNAVVTWNGTTASALNNTNLTYSANALSSASSLSISAGGGNLALVGNTSITAGSDFTPLISGTYVNGSAALPWQTVSANQYGTTLVSYIQSGATQTINWNLGSSQQFTFLNGLATTATITMTNGIPGSFYSLKTISNASGTAAITWASNTTLWPAGTPATPTLSTAAVDLVGFYYDGSKYMGNQISNFS